MRKFNRKDFLTMFGGALVAGAVLPADSLANLSKIAVDDMPMSEFSELRNLLPTSGMWFEAFDIPRNNRVLFGENQVLALVPKSRKENWSENGEFYDDQVYSAIKAMRQSEKSYYWLRSNLYQRTGRDIDHIRSFRRDLTFMQPRFKFLNIYEKPYVDLGFHPDTAAHLIPESGLNPRASSSAGGRGLHQNTHYGQISRIAAAFGWPHKFSRDDHIFHGRVSPAFFAVEARRWGYPHMHGSVSLGMNAYHSGPLNAFKIESVGAFVNKSPESRMQNLLMGRKVARQAYFDRNTKAIFKSYGYRSLQYLEQVAGHVTTLEQAREGEKATLESYVTTEPTPHRVIKIATGLNNADFDLYNPHITEFKRRRSVPTGFLIHAPAGSDASYSALATFDLSLTQQQKNVWRRFFQEPIGVYEGFRPEYALRLHEHALDLAAAGDPLGAAAVEFQANRQESIANQASKFREKVISLGTERNDLLLETIARVD